MVIMIESSSLNLILPEFSKNIYTVSIRESGICVMVQNLICYLKNLRIFTKIVFPRPTDMKKCGFSKNTGPISLSTWDLFFIKSAMVPKADRITWCAFSLCFLFIWLLNLCYFSKCKPHSTCMTCRISTTLITQILQCYNQCVGWLFIHYAWNK